MTILCKANYDLVLLSDFKKENIGLGSSDQGGKEGEEAHNILELWPEPIHQFRLGSLIGN